MISEIFTLEFPKSTSKIVAGLQDLNSRINVVLQNPDSRINAVVPNFTFKEYFKMSEVFLLTLKDIVTSALKTLHEESKIAFSTEEAILFCQKRAEPWDGSSVIAAVFISAAEKSFSLSSEMNFDASSAISSKKAIVIADQIGILCECNLKRATKSFQGNSEMNFAPANTLFNARKDIINAFATCGIIDDLTVSAKKRIGNVSQNADFKTVAKFVAARLRKWSDIADLTFADISTWTLQTFDMIEL